MNHCAWYDFFGLRVFFGDQPMNKQPFGLNASLSFFAEPKHWTSLATACAIFLLGGCDSGTVLTKEELAARLPIKLSVLSETPTYAGHGFVNALDGDPNNNYVAGIDDEKQAVVVLGLEASAAPVELRLMWNDPAHFAKKVRIFGLEDQGGKDVLIGDATVTSELTTSIPLKPSGKFKSVKVVFSEFSGQPRVLLRVLELR